MGVGDGNNSEKEEEKNPKVIDQPLVFKAAMSSNYSQIRELEIMNEGVTLIDNYNPTFKLMSNSLRKLDLPLNKIRKM